MNTKGFVLIMITVIIIGGSVGGAFSGGLALGRSQNGDEAPESAILQQRFGGGQITSDRLPEGFLQGGGSTGGQFGGAPSGGQQFRPEGDSSAEHDAPSGFRSGSFGGRDGFGGILSGTVGTVDGDSFTVTTDSGETQVNLNDNSTIQLYKDGSADDLSPGDRVLVVVSGDAESGEPVGAVSVIVNPPEGGAAFGGGGFGGRPRSP